MRVMDASKVRKSLARILLSVRDDNEKVLIMRYGQPMAALVAVRHLPPDDRKKSERIAREGGISRRE
jgi:antitoxin (DNA-binding transcriptional repressor) of toxin-antitoxin stability system